MNENFKELTFCPLKPTGKVFVEMWGIGLVKGEYMGTVLATVTRRNDGSWDWRINPANLPEEYWGEHYWGNEPKRIMAAQKAANVIDELKILEAIR